MSEQPDTGTIAARGADHRLWRWGLVAAILGLALIVAVVIVVRAIPTEGEAQVQIAGWKVPVGVVVSTDNVSSHLPGIVVGSLLGNKPVIQIDAGRVEGAGAGELRIKSLHGGRDVVYKLTDATRTLNIRDPLLRLPATEGDAVAVLTSPDSNDAIIVLTGVTLVK